MDAVQATLRRFRNWFVVWFVAQSVAGTAVAACVIDGLRRYGGFRYALGNVTADVTVSAAILGLILVLLLALLVLASLLELRPWARIVFLIIGWISVVSSVSSLVMLPGTAALLERAVGVVGGEWRTLQAVDIFTKIVDLVFWSWAISVLQFNPVVRRAFVGERCDKSGTSGPAQHA